MERIENRSVEVPNHRNGEVEHVILESGILQEKVEIEQQELKPSESISEVPLL